MGGLYYDEQNWKLFDNKDLSGLDLEVHSIRIHRFSQPTQLKYTHSFYFVPTLYIHEYKLLYVQRYYKTGNEKKMCSNLSVLYSTPLVSSKYPCK